MSHTPKNTEQLAPDMLWGVSETEPGYLVELNRMVMGQDEDPGYMDRLLTLLEGQPTTAEIEEADQLLAALEMKVHLLRTVVHSWAESRKPVAERMYCPVITRKGTDEARAS